MGVNRRGVNTYLVEFRRTKEDQQKNRHTKITGGKIVNWVKLGGKPKDKFVSRNPKDKFASSAAPSASPAPNYTGGSSKAAAAKSSSAAKVPGPAPKTKAK